MAGVVHADLGRRGRESTADLWRELARKAPGMFLCVATSESDAVLRCVESTLLRVRSHTAANLLQACRGARRGVRYRPPPGRCPESSRREVEFLAKLHDGTICFFALCAECLGLMREWGDGDDLQAKWQAWVEHGADAARHVGEAQQSLRAAKEYLGAALGVLYLLSGKPLEFPPRAAWAWAAERLLGHAVREVTAARDAVLRMRHAVFLEFFDTWMILSRHDEGGCA